MSEAPREYKCPHCTKFKTTDGSQLISHFIEQHPKEFSKMREGGTTYEEIMNLLFGGKKK